MSLDAMLDDVLASLNLQEPTGQRGTPPPPPGQRGAARGGPPPPPGQRGATATGPPPPPNTGQKPLARGGPGGISPPDPKWVKELAYAVSEMDKFAFPKFLRENKDSTRFNLDVLIMTKDRNGRDCVRSALDHAFISIGNTHGIELLKAGANPNMQTEKGKTLLNRLALDVAMEQFAVDKALLVFQHTTIPIDPTIEDNQGYTAIQAAIWRGWDELACVYLDKMTGIPLKALEDALSRAIEKNLTYIIPQIEGLIAKATPKTSTPAPPQGSQGTMDLDVVKLLIALASDTSASPDIRTQAYALKKKYGL